MSRPPLPDQDATRHRALGEKTRVALLGALESSSEPLDAHVLAARVGLHVNTVRWHLGVLLDAGIVTEQKAGSGARGRPRNIYRVVDEVIAGDRGRFGLLAEVLVDALAHRSPDVTGTLEEAGRVRGRMLVRPPIGERRRVEAGEALERVVQLLEGFGFQPWLEHTKEGDRIAMRPCPFGEMAARHSSIICPVHLGLMRGTLEALDAPVEATLLEPFAKPDLCIAHFRTKPGSSAIEPGIEARPGDGASKRTGRRSGGRN
jgi:predicted ArsR family transcriptional regulator